MKAIEYFWRRYWVWAAVLVFITLAVMGGSTVTQDTTTSKQLEETNRQLKRIADNLDIISGQRSGWKLPK